MMAGALLLLLLSAIAVATATPSAAHVAGGCGYLSVAALPYNNLNLPSPKYQVLQFDPSTSTLKMADSFKLGDVAEEGNIVFTADGQYGLVAQKNGTVGVFQLDCDSGEATVLEKAMVLPDAVAYPVRDPAVGDRFWLLGDRAVYSVWINRTSNTVVSEGLYVAAYVPGALVFPPAGPGARQLALLAVDNGILNVYDWAAKQLLANVSAFPYSDPIVVDMCLLTDTTAAAPADSAFLLLLNDNQFGTHRTSCAVVQLAGLQAPTGTPTVSLVQVIAPVTDPSTIACSPYGNSALIASDVGNGLLRVAYDAGNAKKPFTLAGPIPYKGPAPQLPSEMMAAATPSLRGRVFVGELSGVRQVQFAATGNVTDLGLFDFGPDMSDLTGAVGINF